MASPVVLVLSSQKNVWENHRELVLRELLQYFPGNLALGESRYGDTIGLYWHLPEGYNRIPVENLRERITALRRILATLELDALFLRNLLPSTRENNSLFVFDMDSTLIQEEVIDELARKNGRYEDVARVTAEAMQGGMAFEEALRKRLVYLEGLPESVYDVIYPELQPNDGVAEALRGLKEHYHSKIAVLSGGFAPFLERFSRDYSLDYFEANHLEVVSGVLTGNVVGRIVGKERKREALLELSKRFGISRERIVAVGDGANDALMLKEAGIGIGFHAKQGLKDQILNWIDFHSMEALLLLFTPSL